MKQNRDSKISCLFVAGVDEVGRGPLAGPVVTAAVILDRRHVIDGLADSKRLSEKRRRQLDLLIREYAASFSIAQADVHEIDQMNILQATMLAMQRAVAGLTIRPDKVLVDGNRLPVLPCAAEAIIGGDGLVAEISAASIIAKVYRDRMMKGLHHRYPQYGFDSNKGYPTRLHREALQKYGVTPIHRRSFAPVKQVIENRA
ncbi:MAG: ribonuclease HII [Gammaproteobacteria bacterium]|nr:ribonuclease HII [Gammaproteobacteria bacterium]